MLQIYAILFKQQAMPPPFLHILTSLRIWLVVTSIITLFHDTKIVIFIVLAT